MSVLPDNPIALAKLALSDAAKCNADPRYKINMRAWHHGMDTCCEVCIAGSVIAKTLKASLKNIIWPYAYTNNISEKLYAIDYMRAGMAWEALDTLGYYRKDCKSSVGRYKGCTYRSAVSNIEACIAEYKRIGITEGEVQP